MTYKIVNPTLGKPGTKLAGKYLDSPLWLEKALRRGWIKQSTKTPRQHAKTETPKQTKDGQLCL